jgi:hypothetical protein
LSGSSEMSGSVDARLLIRVLSSPSRTVTSVLVPPSALWTGRWPSLRGRRGKPQGSTWVVRLKHRVRGEWNDSASPLLALVARPISPAKPRERSLLIPPSRSGGGAELARRRGQNDPHPRIPYVLPADELTRSPYLRVEGERTITSLWFHRPRQPPIVTTRNGVAGVESPERM